MVRFAPFETPIGLCGIAWRGAHVIGTALPGSSRDELIRYFSRRFPDAEQYQPAGPAPAAIGAILRLLSGEPERFVGVPLSFDAASRFERQVYAAASAIPFGETRTYGQVAAALGEPGAARAVGRALGRNPLPIIIPCHRVLAADGRTGGFSAPGGVSTKMKLLDIERARAGDQPSLFDLAWAAPPPPSLRA
jgi:methylated-DNA-[protein]-cysteine S-methyltransferase